MHSGIEDIAAVAGKETSPDLQNASGSCLASECGDAALSLFSPAGRNAERMRGDEGDSRHDIRASRTPSSGLTATFSPLGRRGSDPVATQLKSRSVSLLRNLLSTATVLVPVKTDRLRESSETVRLTLSAPVNASLRPPITATLTIQDVAP